jgi:hypothetical protein
VPFITWFILAISSMGAPARQEELRLPARELATKILDLTGSMDSIHVFLQNQGQPGKGEGAAFQRELESVFRSRGIRIVAAPEGTTEVAITVADNFQGSVWIAQIQKGENRYVAMVSAPRPSPGGEKDSIPLVVQVRPVYEQRQPILDLVRRDDALAVLDPGSISIYGWSGSWQHRRSVPLAHLRPWPRDLRGRLIVEGSSLRAYLPGVVCKADIDQPGVDCKDADEAWPLDLPDAKLAGGRNYFQAAGLPPFYSIARAASPADPRWLVAGLDGKAYLYNPVHEVLAILDGWGSEVVALRTECSDDTQVLVVLAGDNGQGDSIQVFKIADRRAVPSSPPVQLPGKITALWPAAGGAAAMLVCHNSQANRYEAYQVSVSCGR